LTDKPYNPQSLRDSPEGHTEIAEQFRVTFTPFRISPREIPGPVTALMRLIAPL
jgi:hypothetical protein